MHDTILFYAVGDKYTWNRVYKPGYIAQKYRHSDARGNFQDVSLTGAGIRKGESGQPWRGHDPTNKGRHWAIPRAIGEGTPNFKSMTTQEKLDALDGARLLYWPQARFESDGFPRVKQYRGAGDRSPIAQPGFM